MVEQIKDKVSATAELAEAVTRARAAAKQAKNAHKRLISVGKCRRESCVSCGAWVEADRRRG